MSSSIPGLFKEQEGAANAFANKMFLTPLPVVRCAGSSDQKYTGIVGSAITNMGSALLPLISQKPANIHDAASTD